MKFKLLTERLKPMCTNDMQTTQSESESLLNKSTNEYYRLELEDAFHQNMGGLMNSVWTVIYSSEDDEDKDLNELEDLMDKLQNGHKVPEHWLGNNVRFAFSKTFMDKNSDIISKIKSILNNWDYKVIEKKVYPENIIYEDENQVAYLP